MIKHLPLPGRLKSDLQRVMLPISATGNGGELVPVGTGFVIGAFGSQALVMSAAHVFDEIRSFDRPWQRHHPTSLFYVEEMNVALRTTRMWATYWDDAQGAAVARIEKAWISNPLDIALCSVRLPDDVANLSFEVRLPIDTRPPHVGDRIAALGYSGMKAEEVGSATTYPYRHKVVQKLEWREGHVVEVFAVSGPTGQQWPGFRCDVPFDAGMSGGPVLRLDGNNFAVCGVIHADEALDATNMQRGSGRNALAAMLWPSVVTPVEAAVDATSEPLRNLLELIRGGYVDDQGAAVNHVELIRGGNGEVTDVRWK